MTPVQKHYRLILLLIPLLSLALHLQVFKTDLVGIHVWRQTQTQGTINNFYKRDFNILHPMRYDMGGKIERMEFPVMQWLFAIFFKLFGDHIIISRILSFIIGLCSVYGIFFLYDLIFRNKGIAALGAWAFNWSPVFYYYTMNPMPDNFALCCAVWYAVYFFRYVESEKAKDIIISAVLLGLASLAKLPFILYGSLVFAYVIMQWRDTSSDKRALLKITSIFFIAQIPAIAWYLSVISDWESNGVIKGMMNNKESAGELLHILVGNITSTLPELLINYGSVIFFISGFYFLFREKKYRNQYFPLLLVWGISIIAYFLFEMNMIALVHDYYLLPFLPLLFLIVAFGAYKLLNGKNRLLRYVSVFALLILPLAAYLRINSRWDTENPGFNPVYYKYKDELRALIPKDVLVIAGNDDSHFILLYYIDRIGYGFDNDRLAGNDLEQYIRKGAGYLFTDSQVDSKAEVQTWLDKKIFEKEGLRVYKLKEL